MRDLNFFINPHAKKQHTPIGKILLVGVAAVLIVFAGLFWIIYSQTENVKQDISSLEKDLNDPVVVEARQVLENLKFRRQLLEQYDVSLTDIEMYFDQQNNLSVDILNQVTSAIPVNVKITNYKFTATELQITALTYEETAKAVIVNNLKQTKLFSEVVLESTSLKELTAEDATGPAAREMILRCTFEEVKPE